MAALVNARAPAAPLPVPPPPTRKLKRRSYPLPLAHSRSHDAIRSRPQLPPPREPRARSPGAIATATSTATTTDPTGPVKQCSSPALRSRPQLPPPRARSPGAIATGPTSTGPVKQSSSPALGNLARARLVISPRQSPVSARRPSYKRSHWATLAASVRHAPPAPPAPPASRRTLSRLPSKLPAPLPTTPMTQLPLPLSVDISDERSYDESASASRSARALADSAHSRSSSSTATATVTAIRKPKKPSRRTADSMSYLEYLVDDTEPEPSAPEPAFCVRRNTPVDQVASRKTENSEQRQQSMSVYEKYGLSMVTARPVLPAHLKRQQLTDDGASASASSSVVQQSPVQRSRSPVTSVTVKRKMARQWRAGVPTDTTARSRATVLTRAHKRLEAEEEVKDARDMRLSSAERDMESGGENNAASSNTGNQARSLSPQGHKRSDTLGVSDSPPLHANGPPTLDRRRPEAGGRHQPKRQPTLMSQSSLASDLIASSISWDIDTTISTIGRSRSKSRKKVATPDLSSLTAVDRRSKSAGPTAGRSRVRRTSLRRSKQPSEAKYTTRSRSRDARRLKAKEKKAAAGRVLTKLFRGRRKKSGDKASDAPAAASPDGEPNSNKSSPSAASRKSSAHMPLTAAHDMPPRSSSPSRDELDSDDDSSDSDDVWNAFAPDMTVVRSSMDPDASPPPEMMSMPVRFREASSYVRSPSSVHSESAVTNGGGLSVGDGLSLVGGGLSSPSFHRPRPIPLNHMPPPVASEFQSGAHVRKISTTDAALCIFDKPQKPSKPPSVFCRMDPISNTAKPISPPRLPRVPPRADGNPDTTPGALPRVTAELPPPQAPNTGDALKLHGVPSKFTLKQTSNIGMLSPPQQEDGGHRNSTSSSRPVDFRETNKDVANMFGVVLKPKTPITRASTQVSISSTMPRGTPRALSAKSAASTPRNRMRAGTTATMSRAHLRGYGGGYSVAGTSSTIKEIEATDANAGPDIGVGVGGSSPPTPTSTSPSFKSALGGSGRVRPPPPSPPAKDVDSANIQAAAAPAPDSIDALFSLLKISPDYAKAFVAEEIEVCDLATLSASEIRELLPKLGPRRRLETWINTPRPQSRS